ncbi:MAG: FAD-dependent oxidoreductase [Candidatus Brockarchaeota archaeon]|nr:FAD-dependent oxidoreductase [Candidatus Brockarchaeota archaeon]
MHDVIIVGAGPAGIFASLKFASRPDLKILLLDMGPDIGERRCPSRDGGVVCARCESCSLASGWGGAGAFSDGKITLSPEIGGWLSDILGRERVESLISESDKIWLRFGSPTKVYGDDQDAAELISRKAKLAELELKTNKLRHLGTDLCRKILADMRAHLDGSIEVRTRTKVSKILAEGGVARGVQLSDGTILEARAVLAAPGRIGAEWLGEESRRLGIGLTRNPVDIGVRAEVPAEVLSPLTDALYEPKLKYVSKRFDDYVRTFCVNPHGEVITECYDGVVTVNGHSFEFKRTANTNFAILVSTAFTEPFKEPIAYGKYVARLANLLSGGIIVQRLGDLVQGRRSTAERVKRSIVTPTLKNATPGDLSFILPYRILSNIVEMLKAIDKLAPGVFSKHTLLYGVEAKFYSSRVNTGKNLETSVKNLFVAGDGAGLTRGLSQAAACGLAAAENVMKRLA